VPRCASILAMIETGKLHPRALISRTITLEETAKVSRRWTTAPPSDPR
jgi:hypothetical protein